MMRRMTWAEDTAAVSPLSAHLEWPSAEDEEAEYWEEGTPPVRDNGGADQPADPPDDASDFEGFKLAAWTGSADLDQALDAEPPYLMRRARGWRSRIVIVAAAVVALIGGTAVYVGTRATAEYQRRRRPTSTSVDRQSASTTGTTVTTADSLDAAPDLEPAPASNAAPGSAAPASRQGAPRGTGSTQSGAPATGSTLATSPSTPASSEPNASPPPPPDPAPNPICLITPNLCP
jgi:hypothetical protein